MVEHSHGPDESSKDFMNPIHSGVSQVEPYSSESLESASGTESSRPTQKDLRHVQEELSWQLLAAKKCARDAQACHDEKLAAMVRTFGVMHERHFRMLAQVSERWMGEGTDAR